MPDPTAVPKFSSFKSKTPASSAEPASSDKKLSRSSRDQKERHTSSQDKERNRDRQQKHRSDHRHRRRSKSPRENDKALVRLEKKPQSEPEPTTEALFYLDKRGDPLISRYGTNERGKVPLYRRGGRGRVVGSPGFLVMHRDGNAEEFSIRLPGSAPSALRDRHLFNASFRRVKPRRIKLRPSEATDSGNEGNFIPLSSRPKKDVPEEQTLPEDDGPDYRSIQGKAKAHEYSDSELEYSSSGEDAGIDADDPMRKKSVELSRAVKENPKDIDAWLRLISHQDVLLGAAKGFDREASKAEIHSYADIKISMYESALEQAEFPTHRERLLLGMLLEGAKIWPTAKLERRWDDAMKQQQDSFALWRARLDLRLSNVSTFQFQEVKDAYIARLQQEPKQALHSASPDAGVPYTTSPSAIHEQRIYVFLRLTRFLFDSGYRELAVAAWQAVLELNLHRPAALSEASTQDILSSFRDFWESEAPRIGEDDARGWAHYAQLSDDADPPDPYTENNEVFPSQDVYKSWGVTEQKRAVASRRPARAMDEGNDDDPYRVVIFSDLEKLLFLMPANLQADLKGSLLDGFLLFCDMPLASGASVWMQAAIKDSHIISRSSNLENNVSTVQPAQNPEEDQSKRKPDISHDAAQLCASLDVLFTRGHWFNYLAGWPLRDQLSEGPIKLSQVLAVIKHINTAPGSAEVAAYQLALECIAEPSNIKKRAKGLLKQHPNSCRLYTAYALAEWANGNANTARQVLKAASSMQNLSPETNLDSALLWTSWAWVELDVGDRTRSLLCLCALPDSSPANLIDAKEATAHQILNTRQVLASEAGYSFSATKHDQAFLFAEALALFEYLTVSGGSESASIAQGNISAAMERVWAASREAVNRGLQRSSGHERLLQSAAKLLHFHASRGPFRSSFLREQLLKCIQLFPRNVMFQSLYAWVSSTFGVEDPVRDMLRDVTLANDNDSLGNRIFAIRYEMQRGNTYSTRAAFERALDTRMCRPSAAMWRAYIRFAYSRRELRGKAKEVFFRGIAQCPWSKDLAMEAFTTLVNVMDEFELRSMYNTMGAKGLRIHIDLDEFVSLHKREKKQ